MTSTNKRGGGGPRRDDPVETQDPRENAWIGAKLALWAGDYLTAV